MKRSLLKTAMLLPALLIGCTTEDIPLIPIPPTEQAPAFRSLEFSDVVSYIGKKGELEYVEVRGRIQYNMEFQLQKAAAKFVHLTIATDASVGGASMGGNSTYRVNLEDEEESALVTSYAFSRGGVELSLNIEFQVTESELQIEKLWLASNDSII